MPPAPRFPVACSAGCSIGATPTVAAQLRYIHPCPALPCLQACSSVQLTCHGPPLCVIAALTPALPPPNCLAVPPRPPCLPACRHAPAGGRLTGAAVRRAARPPALPLPVAPGAACVGQHHWWAWEEPAAALTWPVLFVCNFDSSWRVHACRRAPNNLYRLIPCRHPSTSAGMFELNNLSIFVPSPLHRWLAALEALPDSQRAVAYKAAGAAGAGHKQGGLVGDEGIVAEGVARRSRTWTSWVEVQEGVPCNCPCPLSPVPSPLPPRRPLHRHPAGRAAWLRGQRLLRPAQVGV